MTSRSFRSFGLALLLALTGFAAGMAAGVWQESHRALPPPPAPFMAEFAGAVSNAGHRPTDRAELAAAVERTRPQIEEFRARMHAIDAEFDRSVEAVLNPDQRARYVEKVRRHARDLQNEAAPAGPDSPPLTDEQVSRYLQSPFKSIVQIVILPLRLDGLTREYGLDDAQRTQVRDILRVRREKFVELVDSVPPPSVILSRIAPMVQRLAVGPGTGDSPPAGR